MEQIEKIFREDLKLLLKKYSATMSAADYFQGYPECGEDIRIQVDIPNVDSINLGRYIDGDN